MHIPLSDAVLIFATADRKDKYRSCVKNQQDDLFSINSYSNEDGRPNESVEAVIKRIKFGEKIYIFIIIIFTPFFIKKINLYHYVSMKFQDGLSILIVERITTDINQGFIH